MLLPNKHAHCQGALERSQALEVVRGQELQRPEVLQTDLRLLSTGVVSVLRPGVLGTSRCPGPAGPLGFTNKQLSCTGVQSLPLSSASAKLGSCCQRARQKPPLPPAHPLSGKGVLSLRLQARQMGPWALATAGDGPPNMGFSPSPLSSTHITLLTSQFPLAPCSHDLKPPPTSVPGPATWGQLFVSEP